ncbi:hypothetical protein NNO07_16105 [Pseudomonas resinovorans]|uniref:Uncharacterized protein n=1 Tax=Metapseudomonas resinovorans TaxID=53412 RepID=A0ABT4Y7B1_METRE|nr:hypothetical protein [Pseudomonas resinovorans]MDA8484596.1 hypothetical protein [Pseudomonas resinovorans]
MSAHVLLPACLFGAMGAIAFVLYEHEVHTGKPRWYRTATMFFAAVAAFALLAPLGAIYGHLMVWLLEA